ncbi:hypothetical protein C1645_825254 [Glomus cerebriforme]|uniref:Galactose oxidase n=1 Tax=Glomus cerebriforme TaxID=658196 RepID=A0A397SVX2_9GLOM|nr:hypothetical protein C1645_825254 [Glomus cerebriforme]
MTTFKPGSRYGHTATLIDDKLYILGGGQASSGATVEIFGTEFFYLDVSGSFNTQKLLWQNLSNINIVPSHSLAASVKGGANNDTLFLYTSENINPELKFIYTFDSQKKIWDTPPISGNNVPKKDSLIGIINYDRKMYLFGGFAGTFPSNDMLILDTINLIWKQGSLVNAPTPRTNYGATLLPDNNIIYMGGYNSSDLSLNEVYVYNTTSDQWNTKTTSGATIPTSRSGFSAVLGLDGQRIIIFGGRNIEDLNINDALYVLDLTKFEWYIPKISGNIPNSRYQHKANVIGKYMVVSFGYHSGYNNTNESDILLLDISNNEEYVWTTIFEPTTSTSTTTTSSSSSTSSSKSPAMNKKNVLIGATIGSLIGIVLLSGTILHLYKRNKGEKGYKNEKYLGKQLPESIINS